MEQNNYGIIGSGSAIPKKKLKNDDFQALGLETNDEWIVSRTGIKQRYICEEETTASLAIEASRKAIENAGIDKEEIDLIVVATTTPDYPLFPSTACLIQKELDIKKVAAFDISAACTGFICALDVAASMMKSGLYKKALVVGADTLSKYCDWTDRATVVLFGDGAGAVILSQVEEGYGLLATNIGAKGQDHDKLIVPIGGSKEALNKDNLDNPLRYIQMDGKAIYKFAVNIIVQLMDEALERAGLTKEDVTFLIPHQANKRMIDYAQEKLGLSDEQVYVNIDRYGNTSSASIPIAINEAMSKNLLKKGDIVITVGFGAGLTYGANVIKWI
ncbi:MAG: ketoacyl-ACP synthase III [Candidatus Margulisbacteria bacterium]|nr:ketoacyl-ACP synthase III [Candidatus Margulisiibacteriota bacterium]